MRRTFGKWIGTAALAFMLLLAGLVMTSEAHAQRFVDNGNGTVTDKQTALMWTKNANPFGQLTWDDAMSRCISFSISGIGGWRLPSIDELVFLYQGMQRENPFTNVLTSFYWSGSTDAADHALAWLINMGGGDRYNYVKTNTFHVWPVRASQ